MQKKSQYNGSVTSGFGESGGEAYELLKIKGVGGGLCWVGVGVKGGSWGYNSRRSRNKPLTGIVSIREGYIFISTQKIRETVVDML